MPSHPVSQSTLSSNFQKHKSTDLKSNTKISELQTAIKKKCHPNLKGSMMTLSVDIELSSKLQENISF